METEEKSSTSFFQRLNFASQRSVSQMTFMAHLEALRWHIVRALIVWLAFGIAIFVYIDWVFDNIIYAPADSSFISYSALCSLGHTLHIGDALCMPPVHIPLQGNTVNGPFMSAISISMVGALIIAFPYIFWELWRFIKPALSQKEIKKSRGGILAVSVCFFMGALFGYFLLAPFTFNFLANFHIGGTDAYKYLPTLGDYIDTLTNIILSCGLCFELPVLAYVLARIGIINAKFLRKTRKFSIVIILALAAVITPSPDWISQLIVAMPLLLLFELSIIITARVDKSKAAKQNA
jgi:sec-independent protein translocase protein TatC